MSLAAICLTATLTLLPRGYGISTQTEEKQCTNDSCVVANNILDRMDLAVDPCEDFYSYACGGWIKANKERKWNSFDQLAEQNQMVVKRALDQPMENFESIAEQKAKLYYDSCMDLKTVEKLNAKPMLGVIKQLGGWSINRGFKINKKWSLQKIVQKVHNRYKTDGFFGYKISEDPKNPFKYGFHIYPSTKSIFQKLHNIFSSYSNYTIYLGYYLDYMTQMGVLLGGEPTATRKQMREVLLFELKMANIQLSTLSSKSLTLKRLNKQVKFVNWVALFKNAQRFFGWKFGLRQKVDVYHVSYFKKLSKLIGKHLKTDKGKTILNDFLVWQVVSGFITYLSKPFAEATDAFITLILDSPNLETPRWKKCIEEIEVFFGIAAGTIFIRETFPNSSKEHAGELMENVRGYFRENLQNLSWMSEITKEASTTKLDAAGVTIGPLDIFENTTDRIYINLPLREGTYFQNVLKTMYNFLKFPQLAQLIKPELFAPSKVNAYYLPKENHVFVPVSILQNPFYGPNLPPSLNYGGVGTIMGHELAHGFSGEGRLYDENGQFNIMWFFRTESSYKNSTKCLKGFYRVASEELVEQIAADEGGLKAAFGAYVDLMEGEPEPEELPKLPLSHRQLFFVAFAQLWCTTKSEILNEYTKTVRVNGALRNSKNFGEEYGCEVGSEMNPPEKCDLW